MDAGVGDSFEIPVIDAGGSRGGSSASWSLTLTKPAPHLVSLTLTSVGGQTWEGIGGDVFDALMSLRSKVEPDRVQLCCNGARRNAWSSGMQRDMGEGYGTYILPDQRSRERPPEVPTLDAAPPSEVVTVAEQRAWHKAWLAQALPEA